MDNLKLGYGGTKTEMQRLISDAAALSDTVDEQSLSFANVVEAIHVIQKEMEISGISFEEYTELVESGTMTHEEAFKLLGTTAKEASFTISGSLGSMKAAWSNLVTGLADETADVESLIDNFVTSIVGTNGQGGVINNIMPRVEIALQGTIKLIEGLFPKIIAILPELLDSLLPSVVTGAVNVVKSFVNSISESKELLIETAFDSITVFLNGIISMLPDVVQLGFDLIISLANGLAEYIPKLVPVAIDVVLKLAETLTSPETLSNIMDAALILIEELAKGLIEFIPELVSSATEIITKLFEFLTDPELLIEITNAAIDILEELAFSLIEAIPHLVDSAIKIIENLVVFLTDEETLKKLLNAAVDIILTLVNSILNNLDPLLDAAIGAIEALVMFLLDPEVLGKLAAAALDIIFALAAGLVSSVWKLVEAANELGESIGEKLKNMDWKQWGEDLMDSLLDGIKAAWESISGWFSDAWSSIKSLFSGADDAVSKADEAVTAANAKIVEANSKVSSFTDSLKNTAFDVPVNSYQQMGVLGSINAQPPVNITQNIYTSQMTPAEAMQEARYRQELSLIN